MIPSKRYALDMHMIKSIPVGEDQHGHMQFNTVRTEMGELLYCFKYQGKYDKLKDIINLSKSFLDRWSVLSTVDNVLSVPPSRTRVYQPAAEIAKEIARYLNIEFCDDVLYKTTSDQAKDCSNSNLKGTIISTKKARKPKNILLVDDLYQTGNTLNECVRILREDKNINKVFVLTMTKTKMR